MQVSLVSLQPMTIIAYLQFLASNGLSSPTLANHLAAIKANLSLYGIPTLIFQDPRIKYFQRAVTLRSSFKPALKSVIDIDTLQLLVRDCDSTYMGQVFKAVYTLAFFSFLRLSNLVPHSIKTFSPLYHLARGDILFANPGLHIIVKWSKTIQDRKSVKILKIPDLGSNPICPVMAIKICLKSHLDQTTHPCFNIRLPLSGFPSQTTRLGDILRIYCQNSISKIPISHSTHSVVQVPLSPLIRMFHFNISRAMAPGRRNASGDTSPLIIIPLMRWPKIFRSISTFPLLTSWGLGLSTQTSTTPPFLYIPKLNSNY